MCTLEAHNWKWRPEVLKVMCAYGLNTVWKGRRDKHHLGRQGQFQNRSNFELGLKEWTRAHRRKEQDWQDQQEQRFSYSAKIYWVLTTHPALCLQPHQWQGARETCPLLSWSLLSFLDLFTNAHVLRSSYVSVSVVGIENIVVNKTVTDPHGACPRWRKNKK